MVEFKFKLWRSAGAAALMVSACGQPAQQPAEPLPPAGQSGEAGEAAIGESGGEHGEAGVAQAYAGLSGDARTAMRLQQLKGFLLVAAAVNEGDKPDDAAVLVAQGVLEVYDPATDQFGALNVAPVRAVGEASGLSRAQMAQRIQAGEAAINSARTGLTINHADIAARMVDLSTGLYSHVNQADFVDPIEYQHSLGAALSARDALVAGEAALKRTNARAYDEALAALNRFIELWQPNGVAPETPATYQQVVTQGSRVRLALSPYL